MTANEAVRTFNTGENFAIQNYLGSHFAHHNGEDGFYFRVWAPHAQKVQLIGDFTSWREYALDMTQDDSGIWEIFVNWAYEGQIYKYLVTRESGQEVEKIDPFGKLFESRPATGTILRKDNVFKWQDSLWLGRRKRFGFKERPINIYEVHTSSWKRASDGSNLTFKDLTVQLIPYLVEMHYTHVEFMPLMAHPLDVSWGYQSMGYFALEHTFGRPEEFKEFVNTCHQNNIGVIVDWVPGHFTQNDDALAYFDGTPLFEYTDYDRAHNYRWGALNFDLGKNQVQSFLISSLLYWINEYHLDGVRVDAVSNMLYLDYDEGPWKVNHEGTNINLEGFHFLRKLNGVVKRDHPDLMMIAEEATASIPITTSLKDNGLGFDYKWNMGWMNDTLKFFEEDPVYRQFDYNLITFSFMYSFKEHYILPFSHDEVVHGKKSLMHKMWGDRYNQFAGLRNLYTYQICHPGKKLLFMGSEFGQFLEWKCQEQLEWSNLEDEMNRKMQLFTRNLNTFYKDHKSLWQIDDSYDGIEIIDADNSAETVLSFIRRSKKGEDLICVFNMTPVERQNFTIGVPNFGIYEEIWNTELVEFGGVWIAHNPNTKTKKEMWKDYKQTLSFTLPAMGASIWRIKRRLKD